MCVLHKFCNCRPRLPDMSRPLPPSASRCVYDVPMALNQSLTHTRGLEPECAKSNNKRVVREARKYTSGPMPVRDFINNFLDSPDSGTLKSMRSSRGAFRSIPSCAATSAEIYDPLVRLHIVGHRVRSYWVV